MYSKRQSFKTGLRGRAGGRNMSWSAWRRENSWRPLCQCSISNIDTWISHSHGPKFHRYNFKFTWARRVENTQTGFDRNRKREGTMANAFAWPSKTVASVYSKPSSAARNNSSASCSVTNSKLRGLIAKCSFLYYGINMQTHQRPT